MIKSVKNSKFISNVAILLTGNIFGQLIPILSSIVLTRLYFPNDFAILAYFLTITGVLSVIVGGRYEIAIMLPKENIKANALFLLSILFNITITISVSILCFLFGEKFAQLFNASDLNKFIYLIPISIFFSGLYQSASFYSNRLSKYKLMSSTIITRSIFTSGSNILFGWLKVFPGGLIIGTLIGQFVAAIIMSVSSIKEVLKDLPSKREIKLVLYEYKDFPLKNGISIFFNLLANQVPILFIGFLFHNNEIIGWYALVIRVLNAPLMTIGKSVSQVFYQKTNQEKSETNKNIFIRTSKALFLIILLPTLIILLFGPILFKIVFGQIWEIAGYYAQIFILFYMIRFVFSSQSTLLISSGKLKTELIFNVSFFLLQIISVITGYLIGNHEYSFMLMSLTGTLQFIFLGKILLNSCILMDSEKIS